MNTPEITSSKKTLDMFFDRRKSKYERKKEKKTAVKVIWGITYFFTRFSLNNFC